MIRALLTTLLLLSAAAQAGGVRRFAVIVGNDEGGLDTRPLLYARDDAKKIHEILTRLGSVKPEDSTLLLNGSAQHFLSILGEVERRVLEAGKQGEKTALIVYYSGHAKDGALRMGDSAVSLEALKVRLSQAPADVRIGIIDACRSGVLTRTKGARKAPEFEIDTGLQRDARGMVLLTSSSASEDSQESDLIGGSYFSHHFASGLLGDADRSRDGRVSLGEAYAYAYDRTVADTAESLAGAQHPTFSYDLAGNGDIVLTDLVQRTDGLHFPAEAPAGTYYLVDARGFVTAEVWKKEGEEKRIALAPGDYRIKRRLPDRLQLGEVRVGGGRLSSLAEVKLREAPFSDDPVKGVLHLRKRGRWSVNGGLTYQSFFDKASRDYYFPPVSMLTVEAVLHDYFRSDWTWNFDASFGGGPSVLRLEGLVLPYRFSELSLGTTIGAEFPLGAVIPFVGGRAALLAMTRTFDDTFYPAQNFFTFSPGLAAGVHLQLGERWRLSTRGRVHYLLYNVDQNRSLGYWELAGTVSYGL